MIYAISLILEESDMNRSYPQMPIKKASEQVTVVKDYMDLTDRFVAVTIKFDEFSEIATNKGYCVAEAALAMACDHINSLIITAKTIKRIDISTILLVVACNRIDQREIIEQRVKKVINSATNGGGRVRCAYALFPDDGNSADSILHRMKATMPASWSRESDKVIDNGVDFKKEIARGNILTYVQGIYYPNRDLRGVELLARWRHKDVGIVPPSTFLEGIQTQGAACLFLKLLLRNASKVLKEMKSICVHDLIVSINVNPINLMSAGFIEELTCFAKNNETSNIELELVETDDFDKLVGFNEVMASVRMLGYRLAIDDFGSRYAWINSLGDHVSTIKLDRTLTQRISKGSNTSRAELVVTSVVNMAKSMNLEVIAEGVEDKADFDVMNQCGVTALQGYFYGAPVPVDDFIKNYQIELENNHIFEELKGSSLFISDRKPKPH